MNQVFRASRWMVILGAIALLLSAGAAFAWSATKTLDAIVLIATSFGHDSNIPIALVSVVDSVLIGSVLFVSAASLYEIFIAKLDLPNGMLAHNLYELKSKLSAILVLIMALKFVEHLVEWKDAMSTLFYAIGIGIVSGVLIALGYLRSKE